jgi:hypothetical protein
LVRHSRESGNPAASDLTVTLDPAFAGATRADATWSDDALNSTGKPAEGQAMPDRILVINPNSTDAVTRAIDDAMAISRIRLGRNRYHGQH